MPKKTPLENYILGQFKLKKKEHKAMIELEKYGTKLPSGGHVWTGADLIKYFEARKKKKRKSFGGKTFPEFMQHIRKEHRVKKKRKRKR